MPTNWKQLKAIEQKNKERLLAVCPQASENSGIYGIFRVDENDIKFAYIGQAKHCLTRLAQHLSGYKQHIDNSIRKHGFYNKETTPYGYSIGIIKYCPVEELDLQEKEYIKRWAKMVGNFVMLLPVGKIAARPTSMNASHRAVIVMA